MHLAFFMALKSSKRALNGFKKCLRGIFGKFEKLVFPMLSSLESVSHHFKLQIRILHVEMLLGTPPYAWKPNSEGVFRAQRVLSEMQSNLHR